MFLKERCSHGCSYNVNFNLRLSPFEMLSTAEFQVLKLSFSLMPILGDSVPPSVQPLYFKSLIELDKWTPGQADRYDGVLKFKPRGSDSSSEKSRGKLLVSFSVHYLKDV